MTKPIVRGGKMRLNEVRGSFDYSKQLHFVIIIHFSFLLLLATVTAHKVKVPLNIPVVNFLSLCVVKFMNL